jgi:hypothetical protein
MMGNVARRIRMPHASERRLVSAAIRIPGPAENRSEYLAHELQLFLRVLIANPSLEKTVRLASATRVYAKVTRCTALTARAVLSTAGADVPANGVIVAMWTANAVRAPTFAA